MSSSNEKATYKVNKAVLNALEFKGTPVMTIFSREEDMRGDQYRPGAMSAFKAKVKEDGTIKAWYNRIVQQPVGYQAMLRLMPSMTSNPEKDGVVTEGAVHMPYIMENRSVGNSQQGFFTECFMDECAYAAGVDLYVFRKQKLGDKPRFEKVLDKVAKMSNWDTPLAENRFRGISLHKSFGSIVGEVAEITMVDEKTFSIDQYYCAVDCGTYVNPNTVESQMQSGIIFGLSAALYGEITFEEGKIVQQNFPQYEMVRMQVTPDIKVHIMENEEYPGGVGEPGTPPAASALVNALFQATGERIRTLPLMQQGFKFV